MSYDRADGKGRGASTQSFEEKTAAPIVTSDVMARCRLRQLRMRWGADKHDDGDWKKVQLVKVEAMGQVEFWSREYGAIGGDDATFICVERRKAE